SGVSSASPADARGRSTVAAAAPPAGTPVPARSTVSMPPSSRRGVRSGSAEGPDAAWPPGPPSSAPGPCDGVPSDPDARSPRAPSGASRLATVPPVPHRPVRPGSAGRALARRLLLAQLGREHRDLGAALEPERREDVRHVVLDGLLREVEALADLAVGQALAGGRDDLALLRGQALAPVGRLVRGVAQTLEHARGAGRVEQRTARGDRAHGADEVGPVDLLEHVPRRAGEHGLEQRL